MPVAPVAGVPPLSTLAVFDRRMANFTPYYIAPGLTHHNFYKENGQIILAAMVAIVLMILLFFVQQGVLAAGPSAVADLSPYSF